ncbi:MAG: hypothetical protein MZV64_32250 [Ignavibacteriales bacterium]|nr:hypothetical protein [Ignavibacteriales bacterium]
MHLLRRLTLVVGPWRARRRHRCRAGSRLDREGQRLHAAADRGGGQHPAVRVAVGGVGRARARDDHQRRGDRRARAADPVGRAADAGGVLDVRRPRHAVQAQRVEPRLLRVAGGGTAAGRGGVPRRRAPEQARRGCRSTSTCCRWSTSSASSCCRATARCSGATRSAAR